MLLPVPIDRELTPPAVAPPSEMITLDVRLTSGLPHRIPLAGLLVLSLVMPTGVARWWRDADPQALVDRGGIGLGTEGSTPPLRLVLRRGERRLGVAPLVAGRLQWLPEAGTAAVLRLIVLDWELRAGTVKGAGDAGSRLRLAWAPAGRAPNRFDLPAMPRVLSRRLPEGEG